MVDVTGFRAADIAGLKLAKMLVKSNRAVATPRHATPRHATPRHDHATPLHFTSPLTVVVDRAVAVLAQLHLVHIVTWGGRPPSLGAVGRKEQTAEREGGGGGRELGEMVGMFDAHAHTNHYPPT